MRNYLKSFRQFPATFWVANIMELFERWAFYGFFMLFANYLTMSTETGALGLSQTEKGIIMSVGTAILYFLPVITGAIADRYGYKPTLLVAYLIYIASFLVMPMCHTFGAVLINYLILACGSALFKPIISATIARVTNEETSSIGFGIFYVMVNIGAFIGPIIALQFSSTAFEMVFYISALLVFVNILTLYFYNPPVAQQQPSTSLSITLKTIFKNIFLALKDTRLSLLLVIVSVFWGMYYQLFQSLPVFITQWVDTSMFASKLSGWWPWLARFVTDANGDIAAEYFTNIVAMFIIVFQLVVSILWMRQRPLTTMLYGFMISTLGMTLTVLTRNPFFLIGAIFIFSIGEMSASPKITEFIGRIAPEGKTALYMGCSFLPVALGNLWAGIISGPVYQNVADKTSLLINEYANRGLEVPAISEHFTQNQLWQKALTDFSMTDAQLSQYLWHTWHPYQIWVYIASMGVLATLALFSYNYFIAKTNGKSN
jgi:dipeptide/tripeptide permease